MGNMKSNLSNNVLDSCYYKSLIYLPAIFQLFLLCNITIVNKRTKENTEWESIIHSKLQPLLFFLAKKKSFHKIIVLIIKYEKVATNCKCIFTQPCMNLTLQYFLFDQFETFKHILPILIKMMEKNLEIEWV